LGLLQTFALKHQILIIVAIILAGCAAIDAAEQQAFRAVRGAACRMLRINDQCK
jgi:hypothetical protein